VNETSWDRGHIGTQVKEADIFLETGFGVEHVESLELIDGILRSRTDHNDCLATIRSLRD